MKSAAADHTMITGMQTLEYLTGSNGKKSKNAKLHMISRILDAQFCKFYFHPPQKHLNPMMRKCGVNILSTNLATSTGSSKCKKIKFSTFHYKMAI